MVLPESGTALSRALIRNAGNCDSNATAQVESLVDVATAPTFTVGTPKVLFRLPGPLGANLGNISRDGQRFVFAINVPAAGTR